MAQAIAGEINIALTQDEETRLASARAVDPAAHEQFLKGQYYMRKSTNTTSYVQLIGQAKRSLEYFQQAVELDPDWALAHAALAVAYHWLASSNRPEFQGFWEKSKAEARKALALDETVAQAHASLGFILLRHDKDFVEAEREVRRALELEPNSFPIGVTSGKR